MRYTVYVGVLVAPHCPGELKQTMSQLRRRYAARVGYQMPTTGRSKVSAGHVRWQVRRGHAAR